MLTSVHPGSRPSLSLSCWRSGFVEQIVVSACSCCLRTVDRYFGIFVFCLQSELALLVLSRSLLIACSSHSLNSEVFLPHLEGFWWNLSLNHNSNNFYVFLLELLVSLLWWSYFSLTSCISWWIIAGLSINEFCIWATFKSWLSQNTLLLILFNFERCNFWFFVLLMKFKCILFEKRLIHWNHPWLTILKINPLPF